MPQKCCKLSILPACCQGRKCGGYTPQTYVSVGLPMSAVQRISAVLMYPLPQLKLIRTPLLVATCQQVATSLSISSSCNKPVEIRLVATSHLQTCYNLLKQSTCNKSVDNLQHTQAVAMPMHPDIDLLTSHTQKDLSKYIHLKYCLGQH